MEENIKVMVLGQQKLIKQSEILELKPLFTQQSLSQIHFPFSICKFQPNIDVLHSCTYYIISVEKNLKLSCSLEFRERCLASISEYYIKQKMDFQLYQYGFLVGKILSIPIERTMHIIYFLVYTRLASKPFINSLIAQGQRKGIQIRKKTTIKSQKQASVYTKSHQSRHFTIFFDNSQIQTDNLKKQLRSIMSPSSKQSKKMTKKIENKRYFNLKKIYPDDPDLKSETMNQQDELRASQTSRVMAIPVKVRKNENSSIISRLKLKSGTCSEDAIKKIQVRRQKFNDWLESCQKIDHLMSHCDLKENRRVQWGTFKNIAEKDQKTKEANAIKNQKHPYQYYQSIASSIRNKNEQLDSIRFECIHHNQKNMKQSAKFQQNFCDRGFKLSKHLLKTQSEKIQAVVCNQTTVKTNRQFKENVMRQEDYLPSDKQKDFSKMSKTASNSKISENGIQQQIGSIITRKNENVGDEDDSFMLFNKKIKNKLKIQKYKQDYRHFLKTQIFQRFKDTV